MKTLVVYYSRTGITKKVAEFISKELKCDIEEIIDLKDRSGAKGYLFAGKDATFKKLTKIKNIEKDPSKYDLVIIGTPVWAFTMSSAIRTYLTNNKFKKLAFFCTMGGNGGEKTFLDMKELSKEPVSKSMLLTKEVAENKYEEKVKEFLKNLF